ncbi:putative tetratricopeptide-like helical domain-containing protein [Medicago truncatula]|uniref:PPR containing plant-like protein n=1 Tax=Medicago truncatula TaxID=3880 RepID=A0A072VSM8_MEDTR|nr:pentatricopeptide repeat-containing protein At3g49240, mitochondrial [Medicago truncatula]KEH44403.1 PPR containing plant-like protein [Medicago truncatula]RHN82587.1 putative tetratricopeptide-like helical domain-containing protein [Medicago truncatula]
MALSKATFLTRLKTVAQPNRNIRIRLCPRFLSFASPVEAAAERRRSRMRQLRIEPLSALNPNQQQSPNAYPKSHSPPYYLNPSNPKLPERASALTGNRVNLHNTILTLISKNDLDEAALYTRHSIYSNCRPTIFTVNAVLSALLRQSRYSDLLSLHRFITQAGIVPNIITHNLIFQTYLDCRKPDTALDNFKQFIKDAPVNPLLTTFRILIKGLVDNNRLDRALDIKNQMHALGFAPDPLVYHYLMLGHARSSDGYGVLRVYQELKEKLGGVVEDGVVLGCLMKGYFLKGMEKEAMECYQEVFVEGKKMSDIAYNSVLDALAKNGKFDEAMKLFNRMIKEHNPPAKLAVNLGSFNVMVDGYCAEGKFKEAIEIFRSMGESRCKPDTLSFNNLIEQLCNNGMILEAEEVYGEMEGKGVNHDEYTYGLLMDTCFKENRPDDAASYFKKMVESGLRPNLAVYNRLVDGLVKVGKTDDAKSFFDLMVKKLKMDVASYQYMMKVLSKAGKLDDVLQIVDMLLDDNGVNFDEEFQEFVKVELRKEGKEEDLAKLMEEKERLKAEAKAKEAEAVEATKNKKGPGIILTSMMHGNKETESESSDATATESELVEKTTETADSDEGEAKSDRASEQLTA